MTGPPPPPPSYSLTVTLAGSGNGNGQVTSDVGTIDCPASTCTDTYVDQTVVTLDAVAPSGTIFTGWSGAGCSGTLLCVVTMNQAQAVTATFEVEHILTVQLAGLGSGTVSSDLGSISCPITCADSYGQGTTVTLTAVPDPTMEFTSWNGTGCSGTSPCAVTLLQAEIVTATFATDTTGPTVTIDQAGGQSDPTNASSIDFTVVFSESVADFATSDVTISGTAGATTGTVTEITPNDGTTYTVAVTGMTTDGLVSVSIGAGVASDSFGNPNSASTSTDNEVTFISEAPPPTSETITFRNGENSYTDTQDTFITEGSPTADKGNRPLSKWDVDNDTYALVRFANIFGSGAGQIPQGVTIQSATLTLEVFNAGDAADIYESAVSWVEAETFNSFGGEPDVQADELGVLVQAAGGAVAVGTYSVDVTGSLSQWSLNPSANQGWIFKPTDSDRVDFRSSEYGTSTQRPKLSVTYISGP